MKTIKTIGIIGFGAFGQLMHRHLSPHFKIKTYDRNDSVDKLKDTCITDIIIFAVPVQSLEDACQSTKNLIKKETIIIDVTSVKMRPLEILKKYFPNNPLLGTHPIFGPQTEKDLGGIKNLPIVLTNQSINADDYKKIVHFLHTKLKLKVIEKTASQHEKEMALVQGLSHFIGRALQNMNIDYLETGTHSYNQLVKLKEIIGSDSWELFETIQNNNPHICDIRKNFIKELQNLEDKLGNVC